MQRVGTSIFRFGNAVAGTSLSKPVLGRNLCHLAKNSWQVNGNGNILKAAVSAFNVKIPSCNAHTKAETELVEFLTEEILAERKVQKQSAVPATLNGFTIKLDGAEVELIKETAGEKIKIAFNVNHTVDTEENSEAAQQEPAPTELTSKPQFEIDIIRGNTTLSFTCNFLPDEPQEGEYDDVFGIDEICIYENKWNENIYAVAGDVLDGYLYDLLISLLEEKGINKEFVSKLSQLATSHEHNLYISLLEKLSKFTAGKGQ